MKKTVLNTSKISLAILILLLGSSCKHSPRDKNIIADNGRNSPVHPGLSDSPLVMEMRPESYPPSENKIYGYLTNLTGNDAFFGMDYFLEYYDGAVWQEVVIQPEIPIGVNSLAIGLPAHGKTSFDIYLYREFHDYKPGRYRASKEVTVILTAGFGITPSGSSRVNENHSHSSGAFGMTVHPGEYPLSTDSLSVAIVNSSNIEIGLYGHYFIEHFNEGTQYWERYYYPGIPTPDTAPLPPGSSLKLTWPLSAAKTTAYAGINGFEPGKYRLCKYAKIRLSAEFNIEK